MNFHRNNAATLIVFSNKRRSWSNSISHLDMAELSFLNQLVIKFSLIKRATFLPILAYKNNGTLFAESLAERSAQGNNIQHRKYQVKKLKFRSI